MKKFLRLISLCFIPGLMFVFFNAALAGSPDPASQVDEFAGQTYYTPGVHRASVDPNLPQLEAITGLSITFTSPVFAGVPTYFTATRSGGTQPIYYAWSFDDGSFLPPDTSTVVSHTYALAGTYSVAVTAINIDGPVTQTVLLAVIDLPYKAHLPVIFKDSGPPPQPADLICSLSLDPPTPIAGHTVLVAVQIQDRLGHADGFWVDFYINPTTIPAPDHLLPWQDACGGPSSCSTGIAWRVSDAPLLSGINRTLVSIPRNFHPDGFDLAHTNWTGSLPTGTYNLYAYVDSIDSPVLKDTDGAVFESNEWNNRCEILNLVVPAASIVGVDERPSNNLPARPMP